MSSECARLVDVSPRALVHGGEARSHASRVDESSQNALQRC